MRLPWYCSLFAFALAACVFGERIYPPHLVNIRNVGVGALSDVVIDYGKPYVFRDSPPIRPGRMRSDSVGAPVPDLMVVTWRTANGSEHKLSVPLRSKVSYVEKFLGFELLFYDERLEVYHLTSTGSKDEFTNRKRIYPD